MEKFYGLLFLHNGCIYALEVSIEFGLMITSGADGNVCIVDVLSGQLQQTLSGHEGSVWNIIVTSSNIITAGLDETIRVWDLQSGKCIAILMGHVHRIEQMLLTKSKKYLISRDKVGYLIAWSANWDETLSKP